MVSKARLDFPEPERPVTTISRFLGSSIEMFFRLCTRAPCTAMVLRGVGLGFAGAVLPLIGRLLFGYRCAAVEKSELIHIDVALLSEAHRKRSLSDQTSVG